MPPLGHHLILHLRDDRVIASTPAARRRLARSVLSIGRSYGLLAFRAADTHLHVEALCAEPAARELSRRLRIGLVRALRLPIGFREARFRPIESQGHLARAFAYILRQEQHHGTDADPLFDASHLPELLGLRLLDADVVVRVRAALPRVSRAELLAHLGVVELDHLGAVRLDDLADSAAGAFGLPHLEGRSEAVARARHAAVAVARPHAPAAAIGRALGLGDRRVRQLAAAPPGDAAVRAVRRQLALRAIVRARAGAGLGGATSPSARAVG